MAEYLRPDARRRPKYHARLEGITQGCRGSGPKQKFADSWICRRATAPREAINGKIGRRDPYRQNETQGFVRYYILSGDARRLQRGGFWYELESDAASPPHSQTESDHHMVKGPDL